MSKKIVILNGSPRRNGNTSAIMNEFTKGAESTGHTVTEFFLEWKNLGHVLAGGNGDVRDIAGTFELKQAYELGKSI